MNKDLLKKFQHNDWDNQWSGNWSILSFSHWGSFYSQKPFTENIDQYVSRTITIWREGKSAAYQRLAEKEIFANKLIKQIRKDEQLVTKLCEGLRDRTDDFLKFVEKWIGGDITLNRFQQYQKLLVAYYPNHIQVKVLVDYLPKDLLNKFLPLFEEVRVYAEPVFSKSIEFTKAFSKIQAQKTGYASELIKAMVAGEFKAYCHGTDLPAKNVLAERHKASAYLFLEGTTNIVTGEDVKIIEGLIVGKEKGGVLKGATAYPGKVKGVVRIIVDPNKADDFQAGDILVTGMTRPEYLPLMEKAAAFVTDGGGILCHAAIVARELKKPCVIGTKAASKILKDGDMIEVDAEKGIVRKI